MTLRYRLAALALAVAFLGALAAVPLGADAQAGGLTQDVKGKAIADDGTVYKFAGTVTITQFADEDGVLTALGTIEGTAGEFGAVEDTFSAPVNTLNVPGGGASGVRAYIPQDQPGAACPILHLRLGPLLLDVLGLVVEIPQPIILNVRAEPGEGNLLGNLLCAVAGLLDPGPIGGGGIGGALTQIVALLNQILGALGG